MLQVSNACEVHAKFWPRSLPGCLPLFLVTPTVFLMMHTMVHKLFKLTKESCTQQYIIIKAATNYVKFLPN